MLIIVGASVLLIICRSVLGYESVYDIIERNNHRRHFNEPNHYTLHNYNDFDRYPTYSRRSDSVYSSVATPFEYNRPSIFGYGYDNIGNGNVRRRDRLHNFREAPFHRRYQWDHRRYDPRQGDHNDWYYFRPRNDGRKFDDRKISDRVFEATSGLKGNSEIYKVDSVVSNNEDNNQRQSLENFRNNKISVANDSVKKENYGEKIHTDKNAENKSTLRSNKVSKKGHVTKGFSSHHHKDETGNSTVFFDEFSDHGGQSDYRDVADGYGTKTTIEQVSNAEDAKFFDESGGQTGNYGSGSVKDNQKYEKDFVLNNNRFDKDENFQAEGGRENLDRRSNFFNFDGRYGPHDYHFPHNYFHYN